MIDPSGQAHGNTPRTHRKVLLSVGLAVLLLMAVELAAQLRSQWLYGISIFAGAAGERMYVDDPGTGLKLLRPGAVMGGSRQSIRTNSLGLRSDEVSFERGPGSFRAVVVGASSVMGAYAFSNKTTFPAILQAKLRTLHPERQIEVVNAGIAGFTLDDQIQLIDRLIWRLRPDLVVVYPGFNDFAAYCRPQRDARADRQSLPRVELPKWLLSVELLLKNTHALRDTPSTGRNYRRVAELDTSGYQASLRRLTELAAARSLRLVLAANARSYRRDQPLDQQQELATSARYFNPCFDLEGLHQLYERHNELIATEARRSGVPLFRLDQAIPGGRRHFSDGSHFSEHGERVVAELLLNFLTDQGLLPLRPEAPGP